MIFVSCSETIDLSAPRVFHVYWYNNYSHGAVVTIIVGITCAVFVPPSTTVIWESALLQSPVVP